MMIGTLINFGTVNDIDVRDAVSITVDGSRVEIVRHEASVPAQVAECVGEVCEDDVEAECDVEEERRAALVERILGFVEACEACATDGWRGKTSSLWRVVVDGNAEAFADTRWQKGCDFNKKLVYHVLGELRARGVYHVEASREFPELLGDKEEKKYRGYIDGGLTYINNASIQKSLKDSISEAISDSDGRD